VVEIDGEAHNRGNAHGWDAKRDVVLERQGVTVIRIPAHEILANLEGSVAFIVGQAVNGITPPPSCGRSPSPEGEDR
jgi:very-short-patch-repair endonuclease